ncbi:hypothetical protein E8E13_009308 [Curvularia kusanoi]|uniref:Transcription initiation factor TFIID subunit 1 histone acetyltransferase domain-containing protein n=1 Tax=Curvularia kusanoi TaxID=90978 RepID=A0A9P4TH54_CURKU|nr:hypothetical protein E8E13_009308 [Curvularia kusanoi]
MSFDLNPQASAPTDDDDDDLGKLLQSAQVGAATGGQSFLDSLNDRELDRGEKADDAIDYEDISDDDLPEEEFTTGAGGASSTQNFSGTTVQDSGGSFEDGGDDIDDLFGDGLSSPVQERAHQHEDKPVDSIEDLLNGALPHATKTGGGTTQESSQNISFGTVQDDDDDDPEYLLQKQLFEQARAGKEGDGAEAPKTSREDFEKIWPNFEENVPPRFFSLVPRNRAFYIPKVPQKQPKLMPLTKVSLEIAVDQEKSFRLPSAGPAPGSKRQAEEEHGSLIYITRVIREEQDSDDQMELDHLDSLDDHEKIGNVTWGDLKIACEDWEALDNAADMDQLMSPPDTASDDAMDEDQEDWMTNIARAERKRHGQGPPSKKRKSGTREDPIKFSVYDHMDLPSWDDPEAETARIAKKIILDMNDPHLLLDIQQPSAEPPKQRTMGLGLKRDNRGSLANPMFKRYNISNDEAYDALKESSQQKVRSTIGHMNVEHSLPALKLQYPFYKVNLTDRELRSFHRPTIEFRPGERASISLLKSVKRKHKKNLKPSEAFATAEDLNVGDNSDLLLAEYSEEYPTTLSNFGMGIKILNYYRRKDMEDSARPKREDGIGETSVLLPQDKSPFSLFGQVEPGQEVLTLHNAMYRAPVFKHTPESTDFLVSRSKTGVHGSKYYMRNIPNLLVVGQQFPSVEVPGTHARKVTEASKKRLKMLSFRMYRRGEQYNIRQPWVSNEMIKLHLPGTEIAQNRSRMREIMKYDKDLGTWKPQEGETIPDEPTLRTWIKPEDVCLIDSMHAGDKQLQDSGIKSNDIRDDEEETEGENSAVKLAPWNTTKNFLNACAGKAMLELHGEGDPTGQGLGFSFIKVSMKGGFRDIGQSAADQVNAKKQKELSGHSYNVQQQQAMYENAIKRIWNKQKENLSSTNPPEEMEEDVDSAAARNGARGRSEIGTPAHMRGDDDTMSQLSRNSNAETHGKKLRITRTIRNKYDEIEEQVVTVTDPEVIKMYIKRKKQDRLMNMRLDDIKPTGDAEYDRQQQLKLMAELKRLERNMERRQGREKAKGQATGDGGPGKGGATPRKCANCGEVGHIKTNKKLCPLLNGQKKQSDTFKDASAATPVPATPQTAGSPL